MAIRDNKYGNPVSLLNEYSFIAHLLYICPCPFFFVPPSYFHIKAVAFMILSGKLYAIQDVSIKSLPDSIPIVEIIFRHNTKNQVLPYLFQQSP